MTEKSQGRTPTIEERLYADETRPDRVSHIEITDPAACPACPGKPCTTACPARTYEWSEEAAKISIRFENCLECGACRAVCPVSVIRWKMPMGGFGVCYRYG